MKEGLNNIGLAFVWRKQQECHLREMTKIVEDRFKDIERQYILRIISEKSYREILIGQKLCIECSKKERSGIAWFLAGAWKLKAMGRNTDKGKRSLRLGE